MRSPAFERQMLEEVARAAGLWGRGVEHFCDDVYERLKLGEQEYGESWATRDPVELLREIREEGTDIAGWGLLCAQLVLQLQHEGLDVDMAGEVQGLIITACAEGMRAALHMDKAITILKTAKAHSSWQEKVPQPPVRLCSEA